MKKQITVILMSMLLLFSLSAANASAAGPYKKYAEGTGMVTAEGRGAITVGGTGTAVVDTMGNFGYIKVYGDAVIKIENKDPYGYKDVKTYGFGSNKVTKIYVNGIVTISGTNIKITYKTGSGFGKMTAWGTGFAKAKGYGFWKIGRLPEQNA